MSRILKRPMFKKGGSTGEGIMTGLVTRTKHADQPMVSGTNRPIDPAMLEADTQAILAALNKFAPLPKNDAAVTIPVNAPLPFEAIVIAVPTLSPPSAVTTALASPSFNRSRKASDENPPKTTE